MNSANTKPCHEIALVLVKQGERQPYYTFSKYVSASVCLVYLMKLSGFWPNFSNFLCGFYTIDIAKVLLKIFIFFQNIHAIFDHI